MLAGTQLIYRPPLGFFQTARDGQERIVDHAGILARDGQGVQRLLPRIFAQAPGFQRNGCVQADVAQDLFRGGGLAQQQPLAGRPARDLGSGNLMRYVADLDRLRTVRGGAEVDRRCGLGMQRRPLAGRPARDLGSGNLMRYVADLDRLRTVRGGAEVDRRCGLGMQRRPLLRTDQHCEQEDGEFSGPHGSILAFSEMDLFPKGAAGVCRLLQRFEQRLDVGLHFNHGGFVVLEGGDEHTCALARLTRRTHENVGCLPVAPGMHAPQRMQVRAGQRIHETVPFAPFARIRRGLQVLQSLEYRQLEAAGSLRTRYLHEEIRDAQKRNMQMPRPVAGFDGLHDAIEFRIAAECRARRHQNHQNRRQHSRFHRASLRVLDLSNRGMPNSPPRSTSRSGSSVPIMLTMVSSLGSAAITTMPPRCPPPPSLKYTSTLSPCLDLTPTRRPHGGLCNWLRTASTSAMLYSPSWENWKLLT